MDVVVEMIDVFPDVRPVRSIKRDERRLFERPGAALVNMGGAPTPFTVPMRTLVAKCWQIIGTRNHSRIDAHEVTQLMARGQLQIDDLITHRLPLTEVERAVKILRARDEPVWMSVINP
jgi:threonine dehydrogenase-like Zn-dependent dehydrogenase